MSNPILGLDLGTKRVGVALSPNQKDIQALPTIAWQLPHNHNLIKALLALVEEHEVARIVIGIPLSEDSDETSQSTRQERLMQAIRTEITQKFPSLDIIEVNEFRTSQDGQQLFPGLDRDAAAACLILQQYLEAAS